MRVGEKLTIAYDKSIIYEMKEMMSVQEFAERYDMSEEDLLTLNYVDDPADILKEGQQIFVPLNKIEAEQRGLIEKRKFVMLDIAPEEKVVNMDDVQRTLSGSEGEHEGDTPSQHAPHGEDSEQVVISAEESAKRLQQLDLAKIEAKQAAIKAEELEEQAKQAAAEVKIQEENQKTEAARVARIEAEKKAEAARLAKIDSEKKAKILAQAEEKEVARKAAAVEELCGEDQCYHEGKCRSKPTNARCAPVEDGDNAWLCKDGYVDTGRACISSAAHTEKVAQATAPKKGQDVLTQRYFNPYKQGYNNGR